MGNSYFIAASGGVSLQGISAKAANPIFHIRCGDLNEKALSVTIFIVDRKAPERTGRLAWTDCHEYPDGVGSSIS